MIPPDSFSKFYVYRINYFHSFGGMFFSRILRSNLKNGRIRIWRYDFVHPFEIKGKMSGIFGVIDRSHQRRVTGCRKVKIFSKNHHD